MKKNWKAILMVGAAVLASTRVASASPAHGVAGDQATAVFAGGCFWGVDAVFKHVRGVAKVVSGYAGGAADTANYETVSTGTTGHAESVQVTYDPSKVSYEDLLTVFFLVAHDPTELNRQGPDDGTQYRSSIFYVNDAQKKMANAYIAQLDQKKVFAAPIVTTVVPLRGFYPAETYHQNYLALHPDQPYIVYNDLPKLERLRTTFPALYQGH
jgi:peptide-methionine (S)-S-oxide reductase